MQIARYELLETVPDFFVNFKIAMILALKIKFIKAS